MAIGGHEIPDPARTAGGLNRGNLAPIRRRLRTIIAESRPGEG